MSAEIEKHGENVIFIRCQASRIVGYACAGISIVLFILFMRDAVPSVIIPLFFFVLGFYMIFSERDITCTIDKNESEVIYDKGGILGTSYDAEHVRCRIWDLRGIETQRYVSKRGSGRDSFQIRLVLKTEQRLRLFTTTSYSECSYAATFINQFLDSRLLVVAME